MGIFGGTRSGKTTGVGIPTLHVWKGTIFAIDIAGDLSKGGKRKSVATIDFIDDDNSYAWDVFAGAKEASMEGDFGKVVEEMDKLAMTLIPPNPAEKEYFINGARQILTAALIYYYSTGMDFVDICEKILDNDADRIIKEIQCMDYSKRAKEYITGFNGVDQKNISSCKDNLNRAIRPFVTNEKIRKRLQKDTLSPSLIENIDIFIRLNQEDLETYSSFMRVVTGQILRYLSRRNVDSKNSILIMLDEFLSLGYISGMTSSFATLAKRRVRIMLLTQSKNDIDLTYGKETESIMENCAYKALLQVKTPDEQRYFADLIGKIYHKKISTTNSGAKKSMTISADEKYAVPPDSLGRLDKDMILILPDGYKRLKKIRWNEYIKYKV